MPTIISIEGNTGSGKSTLINHIEENFKIANINNIHFLKEKVDVWESIKDKKNINILEHYYINKGKWSFSFQLLALITKLESIKELIKKHGENIIIICERSFQADREIFVKMHNKDRFINDIELQIYDRYLQNVLEDFKVDGSIYLKTDPIICYSRIKKRKRKGENIINIDYLIKCKKYYDSYFNKTSLTTLSLKNDNNNIEDITFKREIIEYINKIIEEKKDNIKLCEKINLNNIMNGTWC